MSETLSLTSDGWLSFAVVVAAMLLAWMTSCVSAYRFSSSLDEAIRQTQRDREARKLWDATP